MPRPKRHRNVRGRFAGTLTYAVQMEPGEAAPSRRRRDARLSSSDELTELLDTGSVPTNAPKRTGIWIWPWILLIIFVGFLALAGSLAFGAKHIADHAFVVRDELMAARAVVATIPGLATAKDTAGLEAAAAQLTEHADKALAETDDPVWKLFEQIPVVGENLSAVRKTTAAAHILVEQAMPPAIQLLGVVDISRFGLKDGRVDVSAYQAALPMIPALREAVSAAQAQVADINHAQPRAPGRRRDQRADRRAGAGLPRARSGREGPSGRAQRARPERAAQLPPHVPEQRGDAGHGRQPGIPRHAAHRERGDQPSRDQQFDRPRRTSTRGCPCRRRCSRLYESDTTAHMQNFTRTPDFPTSAQMMTSLWQREIGGTIDGVISLDLPALQKPPRRERSGDAHQRRCARLGQRGEAAARGCVRPLQLRRAGRVLRGCRGPRVHAGHIGFGHAGRAARCAEREREEPPRDGVVRRDRTSRPWRSTSGRRAPSCPTTPRWRRWGSSSTTPATASSSTTSPVR